MSSLVSVDIYTTGPSTLEIMVTNCHPDAYDVSEIGNRGKVQLKNFVEYALGLMTIPVRDNPETKQEFKKAVYKFREESPEEKFHVGSLDSEYFLETYKLTDISGADYKDKREELELEPDNETEEELMIRLDKMEELEQPSISVELTFKPEHRNFLEEFKKVSFDTAYDYYTM